jgi:GntR family transcriptional regulator
VSISHGQPFYAQVADALREDIQAGRYAPGGQLPSERELRERFGVSGNTVRAAIVQLRAEGLVTSHQGRGVFVQEQPAPMRRLDTDISASDGFYRSLQRTGRAPATVTTVSRGPASDEVADWLGIPSGTEVVIRDRLMRAEGAPPINLAVSYFPAWVAEAAPNLADPNVSGMPRWLREAFGATYSEDLVDARAASEEEAERLEIEQGSPVLTIKGTTRDQQHRVLHFITVVAVPGQMPCGYRYGAVPAELESGGVNAPPPGKQEKTEQ